MKILYLLLLFCVMLNFSAARAQSGEDRNHWNLLESHAASIAKFMVLSRPAVEHLSQQNDPEARALIERINRFSGKPEIFMESLTRQINAKPRHYQDLDLSTVENNKDLHMDLLIRLTASESVLGRPLNSRESKSLWQAHLQSSLADKAETLRNAGFSSQQRQALLRLGIAGGHQYQRKFPISDSREVALKIIPMIELLDVMSPPFPPGVKPRKVSAGIFEADAIWIKFEVKVTVEEGLLVENNTVTANNKATIIGTMLAGPLGFFTGKAVAERLAEFVHNFATDPLRGYMAARKRYFAAPKGR